MNSIAYATLHSVIFFSCLLLTAGQNENNAYTQRFQAMTHICWAKQLPVLTSSSYMNKHYHSFRAVLWFTWEMLILFTTGLVSTNTWVKHLALRISIDQLLTKYVWLSLLVLLKTSCSCCWKWNRLESSWETKRYVTTSSVPFHTNTNVSIGNTNT